MLERLGEVDWRSLRHAYGSAQDVPGLVRGLASPDKKTRERAYWELQGRLRSIHPGGVPDSHGCG